MHQPNIWKCEKVREEINLRINIGDLCYYSLEKILSSRLLPKKWKINTYETIILSVVLYGCEVWSLTLREEHRLRVFENKVLREILFILQKKAVRIIYGASFRSHCCPLFIEFGILTLPSMFVLSCILYAKENVNSYLLCSEVHEYPTRNQSNIYLKKIM